MAIPLEVQRAPAPRADLLEVLRRSLALAGATDPAVLSQAARLLLKPRALEMALLSSLGALLRQALVLGTLENRLLLLETVRRGWIFAHLGGLPLDEIDWPRPVARGLFVEHPENPVSCGEVTPEALFRLTRPRVLLVALCHPEVFPLPRFPLGISDLARAIRLRFQGQVALADMQLGWTIPDLVRRVEAERPDILGISATFGQYDLLESLADPVRERVSETLLVFGGSLCALNAARLLERYPGALVAHGPGEVTMQDVVELWHGDRPLAEVRGVRAKGPQNGLAPNVLPELDLLEETLDHHGVMQLESSRGCTHACSFCPRSHKGVWVGEEAGELEVILGAVGDLFAARPQMARKIFLVDEEFVGRDRQGEGLERALQVAQTLWRHGFRWETSARVDQICRPGESRAWHVERMRFWTRLREQGMERCLFGLESGVDSILERFNKKTTARQNALAIRLLSACGIPIRCTYITFDHLMSLAELEESYQFQGRKDLLLLPQPAMPFDELLEAVQDDGFAAENALGAPLYASISYMLVSMECLLGSPYLRKVEEAGLARDEMPAMGRRNAVFRDPLIGRMSDCAQRWIDRNFSFDYALKSLEKITAGPERAALRRARSLLKDFSYRLLGRLLEQAAAPEADFFPGMDFLFAEQVAAVERLLEGIAGSVVPPNRAILHRELRAWSVRTSWDLINA